MTHIYTTMITCGHLLCQCGVLCSGFAWMTWMHVIVATATQFAFSTPLRLIAAVWDLPILRNGAFT